METGKVNHSGETVFSARVDFTQPARENIRLVHVMPGDDAIAPDDDPLRGSPYRALRRLGAGSMGEVFLAQHRQLERLCVAKILHAELATDKRVGDRVRLEAQALGRLGHPHIVSIIGAGETFDQRPFIIMEHLRGQTLADELDVRGSLPVLEALSYTCQLLRALAAMHAIGILHRDVKPANLFLCDGTSGARKLKVLDLGIARVMPNAPPQAPEPLAIPTDTGIIVGTITYVSPEAAVGKPVDHRSDLYAAALVLYAMIAGSGPFDHIRSAPLVLSAHVAKEPEPPSCFSTEPIPPELDLLILRALRKSPSERFQSADEFREELEQMIDHLRNSAGWLNTSVFDASSLREQRALASAPPAPDEPARQPGSQAPRSARSRPLDSELTSVQSSSAGPHRSTTSNLKVALIFVSAAFLAAVAAIGIVAFLRGAR